MDVRDRQVVWRPAGEYGRGVPSPDAPGRTLRLSDGRNLGFAELGDPRGRPVFHFHGNPGCRLERWEVERNRGENGIHLITADRPGIGLSDAKPGRSVADWADDVAELADHLGHHRFAVVGYSLGGPYAAACAARLPDRVAAAGLVSANARMDDRSFADQVGTARYFKLARRAPWAMALMYAIVGRTASRNPQAAHKLFFRDFSTVDRAIADRAGVSSRIMAELAEAVRCGARGLVDDMRAAQRPWGFQPQSIQIPVHLWQGRADSVVPLSHAEYWVTTVSDCRPTFFDGEGHMMIEDRANDVFEAVAAHL